MASLAMRCTSVYATSTRGCGSPGGIFRAATISSGHLKQTLVRAAVKVLAKRDPRDFTLREVARQAKVSHNAPTGTSATNMNYWLPWRRH